MEKSIIIVCTVGIILFLSAENAMIKRISNQLTLYTVKRQFDEYEKLRQKAMTRYLFKPFNLFFMDLNAAILQGNQQKTEQCFTQFERIRMNKNQKRMVYEKAFYYYVLIREKEKSTKYYYLLCDGNEEHASKDVRIFYNTFIEEKPDYLEDVLEMLKGCSPDQRADLEALLSKIYENKGEMQLSLKYRKDSEIHFSELEKKNI